MNVTLETLTPELASDFLGKVGTQRKVTQSHVDFLARQIENGKWIPNGETLQIDTNGFLLEGRHRCLAVVQCKIPIETFVTYDVPPEAFSVIDTGRNRNGSDVLSIAGYKNTTNLSSVIRFVLMWSSGIKKSNTANRPTNQDVLDFVKKNPEAQAVTLLSAKYYSLMGKTLGVSLIGGLYWIFEERHVGKAKGFYDALTTGDAATPLMKKLRSRLAKDQMSVNKLPRNFKIALVIKTWNDYILDQGKKQLQYNPAMDNYPQIA